VPQPYLGFDVPLPPSEACTFETWTDPAARGRGVGAALRAAVAAALAEEGNRSLLAMVHPENDAAIAMVAKLGYLRVGTVAALALTGRRRLLVRRRGGVT
jgi:ribosomal protein S18 acetylase RimI-like enzyme